MIYMIYTPVERSLAQKLADQIVALNNVWEFRFAPVGLEAESEEWLSIVEADLESCDFAVLLLTPLSFSDTSVATRLKLVKSMGIPLLPITCTGEDVRELSDDSPKVDLSNSDSSAAEIWQLTMMRQTLPLSFSSSDANSGELSRIIAAIKEIINRSVKPRLSRIRCFISYSRQDADFATKLASDLREKKLKTWRDSENIPAGANWDREIEKAIGECSHVLLIATVHSVASENVVDEISLALNKGKMVIPLMVEKCELPMRIHRAQWIDFRQGYEAALQTLLKQLGAERQPVQAEKPEGGQESSKRELDENELKQ
jgi:hypothetical protein